MLLGKDDYPMAKYLRQSADTPGPGDYTLPEVRGSVHVSSTFSFSKDKGDKWRGRSSSRNDEYRPCPTTYTPKTNMADRAPKGAKFGTDFSNYTSQVWSTQNTLVGPGAYTIPSSFGGGQYLNKIKLKNEKWT